MTHIVKLPCRLPTSRGERYVVNADCLRLLECLEDASVDVVYADPPFNTGVVRSDPRGGATYQDDVPMDEWLSFLLDFVVQCRRVLKPHGSMYLHLDWRGVHEVKVMVMDRVFGRGNYLGEIVWAYDWGARQRDCFSRKHDTVLHYAMERGAHRFDPSRVDRVPYKAPELQMYRAKRLGKDDGAARIAAGKPVTDVFSDINVLGTSSRERALNSYPTMKPAKLIKRLLAPVVVPGAVVLDPFCGSGPVVDASSELGCSFIAGDVSPAAASITSRRASRLGTDFFIVEC